VVNVIIVNDKCAYRLLEQTWMLEYDAMVMGKYQRGDYVKVEFHDDRSGHSEWMWVKVDRSDDAERLVFGKLDNEPIVITNVHLGTELAVSYDNIREHMQSESFGQ
jgi:uncharacterized protein YegJ (DUF2314 family)